MRKQVRRIEVAAVLIAALFGISDAHAGAREKKAAKAHATKAAKLFKAKSYQNALVEFEKAYGLFPAPALLYNMGQCHLFLGDYEKAIDRFESFLTEVPNTPYRDDVER